MKIRTTYLNFGHHLFAGFINKRDRVVQILKVSIDIVEGAQELFVDQKTLALDVGTKIASGVQIVLHNQVGNIPQRIQSILKTKRIKIAT